MKTPYRFAVLLLLLVAPAWADGPKLDIPAEVPAQPGVWVVVAPVTDAKAVVYVGMDGLSAFPSSELKDPRKLVVFAPAAGRYRFVAVGTLNDELTQVTFTVVVSGGPPPPPPPPPPGPKPDGALGLIKASREGLARVAPASATKAPGLAAAHQLLANDLLRNPANYPPGADALATAVLDAKRKANNAAVAAADWKEWAASVDPVVQAAYNAGKLKNTSEWAAALIEIAQGLGGQ